jgi:hypothetical protein
MKDIRLEFMNAGDNLTGGYFKVVSTTGYDFSNFGTNDYVRFDNDY